MDCGFNLFYTNLPLALFRLIRLARLSCTPFVAYAHENVFALMVYHHCFQSFK
jgi:hypothetical protein